MGLTGALVDRARTITRDSTGVKVEGTTLLTDTHSAWFKARLFLDQASERKEQGERAKAVSTPQILIAYRDEFGELVVVDSDMKLEVESPELGTALWRIQGQPQPIRKKRPVIGYLATLERVIEPAREGAV